MDFSAWYEWLLKGWEAWPWILVSVIGAYGWLIFLIRFRGLRSLSKMTAGDFVTTVALGSILANVLTSPSPSLSVAVVILTSVFLVHGVVAKLRARYRWFENVVSNEPVILMQGREVIYENLRQSSLSLDDLRGKLREANVLSRDQVKMVVLEATGDVSVLHSHNTELDSWIVEDVSGVTA